MGDIAVVGTSPVLLLEAAVRARAGSSVTVFTSGRPFGGAWWVDEQAGFSRIETACHLLEADPVGYEVLRSVPGVELTRMTPTPKVHIGRGQVLRYGSPPATAAIAAIGVPAVARAGWRNGREIGPAAGFSAARASASTRVAQSRNELRARHRDILYPVGGAGTLLDGLRQLVTGEGVEFDDRRIEHIEADADRATVTIENEQRVFRQVVVSSGYNGTIGRGATGRTRRSNDTATDTSRRHDQLLLVIPTSAHRALSYERFMTDPILLRASDVTSSAIASDVQQGTSLLMLGLRQPADPEQVIGPLCHQGILTEPVQPEFALTYTHTSRDRADELLAATTGTAVTVVPTFGDLSRSLRAFADRHPDWLAKQEHHVPR